MPAPSAPAAVLPHSCCHFAVLRVGEGSGMGTPEAAPWADNVEGVCTVCDALTCTTSWTTLCCVPVSVVPQSLASLANPSLTSQKKIVSLLYSLKATQEVLACVFLLLAHTTGMLVTLLLGACPCWVPTLQGTNALLFAEAQHWTILLP